MIERPRIRPPRAAGLRQSTSGLVYVEVIGAIIPVFVFFFGLLQLALLYTAKLIVAHAASRAARSAVVVLEDSPIHYGCTARGEITYRDLSGSGESGTEVFLQEVADLLDVDLPIQEVRNMLSSEAGPRLAAIQRAAYMPLATLAPNPGKLLSTFGIQSDTLNDSSNLTQFLVGLLLYNRAAAMVTLRKPDGSVANQVDPTENITLRVTYLYMCTMPFASTFMCGSLMEMSGLDRLDDYARGYYESVSKNGKDGAEEVKDQLPKDLQSVADDVGDLARDLQYAAAPELLLPFMFSRAHFKLVSAEATLPNQGADYYEKMPKECPQPDEQEDTAQSGLPDPGGLPDFSL